MTHILVAVRRALLRIARPILANTFYKAGSIHTIVRGPCRGLRYRIFPGYGLSPLHGGWEVDVQRLMQKYIKLGDVVFDIGANYGIHTLLLARLVSTTGQVYAFEPMPKICASLRENVALNHFANVTCLEYAVSDSSDSASFEIGHNAAIGHLLFEGAQSITAISVPTITLDDAVFKRGLRPPNLIKIDVEGAESRVLSGALRTLSAYHPTLLVELHTPEQDIAVGRILAEYGYTAYRIMDGSRVQDLSKGWPDRDGLWGQVIAFCE